MTDIAFHFNVAERTGYVCRLLRKALRQDARVVVTGDAATLAALDRELWRFDPLEFVPHVKPAAGQPVPARLRDTPVWLVENPADGGHQDVLVNLGIDPPPGFERFARVIEVVSTDADDRSAARERWKMYASRGYAIQRHEAGAA